mgnify:FL=1
MKSNARVRAIIRLLGSSDEPYMSIGDIAEALEVSTKTVSRDLPEVEKLLMQYGLQLTKKTGAGIGLEGSMKHFMALEEFFNDSAEEYIYTPQERQSIIISRLLPGNEPVKLFALASQLRVTDGTISNDLDKLERWFRERKLELIRKPGLGVYIQGNEQDIRKAIVHYIYEKISEEQLLSLLQENLETEAREKSKAEKASGYLLDLVDQQIIHRLEGFVKSMEKSLDCSFSDNAFIGLIVHLSLAVQRIRKNERIEISPMLLQELQSRKEFAAASRMAEGMAKEFDIQVPQDEIGYITMHLLGARNRYNKQNVSVSVMDNFHLVKYAKSIMKHAYEETGKNLMKNQGLLAGLVNHLGPSISRLKMNMEIRNPLLKEMQESYPELMKLSHRCVKTIEAELGEALPDSEIAYIAMHLGAALEDHEPLTLREHRAIVACPTGMGTSRMLASCIRKKYSNIKIVDLVSTLQLTAEYIDRTDAEFVISTVPVQECGLSVIVVNPLFNEQDQVRIENQLRLMKDNLLTKTVKPEQQIDFKEALNQLTLYNEAIKELLDSFFFVEDEEIHDIQALCGKIGRIAGRSSEGCSGIAAELLTRESHGSTLVSGNHMILLHCRSRWLQHMQLGIVHLGRAFAYSEHAEQIRTAIVMIAPQDTTQYHLETIGYISEILLERWGLIEVLHEGSKEHIYEELVQIFQEFFKRKYKLLMGG